METTGVPADHASRIFKRVPLPASSGTTATSARANSATASSTSPTTSIRGSSPEVTACRDRGFLPTRRQHQVWVRIAQLRPDFAAEEADRGAIGVIFHVSRKDDGVTSAFQRESDAPESHSDRQALWPRERWPPPRPHRFRTPPAPAKIAAAISVRNRARPARTHDAQGPRRAAPKRRTARAESIRHCADRVSSLRRRARSGRDTAAHQECSITPTLVAAAFDGARDLRARSRRSDRRAAARGAPRGRCCARRVPQAPRRLGGRSIDTSRRTSPEGSASAGWAAPG